MVLLVVGAATLLLSISFAIVGPPARGPGKFTWRFGHVMMILVLVVVVAVVLFLAVG